MTDLAVAAPTGGRRAILLRLAEWQLALLQLALLLNVALRSAQKLDIRCVLKNAALQILVYCFVQKEYF